MTSDLRFRGENFGDLIEDGRTRTVGNARTVKQLFIERNVEIHLFILCYPLKRRLGTQSILMDNVTKVIVV